MLRRWEALCKFLATLRQSTLRVAKTRAPPIDGNSDTVNRLLLRFGMAQSSAKPSSAVLPSGSDGFPAQFLSGVAIRYALRLAQGWHKVGDLQCHTVRGIPTSPTIAPFKTRETLQATGATLRTHPCHGGCSESPPLQASRNVVLPTTFTTNTRMPFKLPRTWAVPASA